MQLKSFSTMPKKAIKVAVVNYFALCKLTLLCDKMKVAFSQI